jgi:hypothetical protein
VAFEVNKGAKFERMARHRALAVPRATTRACADAVHQPLLISTRSSGEGVARIHRQRLALCLGWNLRLIEWF